MKKKRKVPTAKEWTEIQKAARAAVEEYELSERRREERARQRATEIIQRCHDIWSSLSTDSKSQVKLNTAKVANSIDNAILQQALTDLPIRYLEFHGVSESLEELMAIDIYAVPRVAQELVECYQTTKLETICQDTVATRGLLAITVCISALFLELSLDSRCHQRRVRIPHDLTVILTQLDELNGQIGGNLQGCYVIDYFVRHGDVLLGHPDHLKLVAGMRISTWHAQVETAYHALLNSNDQNGDVAESKADGSLPNSNICSIPLDRRSMPMSLAEAGAALYNAQKKARKAAAAKVKSAILNHEIKAEQSSRQQWWFDLTTIPGYARGKFTGQE